MPSDKKPEDALSADKPVSGFDSNASEQLTLQLLTGAINQQQLTAAQARNQVANVGNVLTLGVQLTHRAALNMLTSTSPMEASAATNVIAAAQAQKLADLQAAYRVPNTK